MKELVNNPLYNAQMVRNLGAATYHGAEIGECLAIATIIKPGDKESWYKVWSQFADKNLRLAKESQKLKLKEDAKSAFFRASSYYRASMFFLEDVPDDKRIAQAMQASIDSFHQALKFLDAPCYKVEIPFEGYTMPGYLYLSPKNNGSLSPLLIDTGGGDGTKEELFFGTMVQAIERGISCLIFEGPGQGSLLRLKRIPFIHDWEKVITAVVDYATTLPEIDKDKIILIGRSFGGYLASRAVTKEKRIAACIVDPGILEAKINIDAKLDLVKDKSELKGAPLSQVIEILMAKDENLRFMMNSRKWRFGASTIAELIKATAAYTLEGLVDNISCPMLICDNTQEYITAGQAKRLYDNLKCSKTYISFGNNDGTEGHCEPLAPQIFTAKIYQWLNKTLDSNIGI